ncbi:hypothetical protein A3850_011105 [Lewinella sp. 4G2]|nr:hypothetical protein A3850_011105 [Lewinella sp. 4G2]
MRASALDSERYRELQHGVPTFSFLSAEQNAFVASEVARLTLKQKAGQMTQVAMDLLFKGDTYVLTTPAEYDMDKVQRILGDLEVGSILNHPSNNWVGPEQWYQYMQLIQNKAMATTGVPVLFGQDAIHGANYIDGATLYAQPLGVAASFNKSLTEELAAMTAYQLKAASIPWNFSPAMDVGRNPAWPRTWESFGEDVYLNLTMGEAMLRGYQGNDVTADDKVVACLKHFTGYGSPLSGRDRSPAYIPERQLREYYLPQYANAIDKGALSVMINSGEINGVPTHANRWLLTDVLRGELGFEGLAVSDWEDVRFLNYRYRIAENLKAAVKLSVDAGMDMSMTAAFTDFPVLLKELVEEGSIPMARIDRSVARIIALKVKAGLYEQHVWNPADFEKFGSEDHAALSLQSAEEAIVLLKNDGLQLPLKNGQTIFLTGPTADNMRSLNGGWTYSWQGENGDKFLGDYHTIKEALQTKFDGRVQYAEGVSFSREQNIAQALELAKKTDVIVVCLGESSYTEIEGNIDNLDLPSDQRDYYDQLVALGKPIVLVMAAGRPRIMTDLAAKAQSVLYLPYPGPRAGDALANILSGDTNPSGRLPLTYPRAANAIVAYDHKTVEIVKNGHNPLFGFGHGLSYSTFTYGDLQLSSPELTGSNSVTVSVTVTNEGDRAGKHSVLLFSKDEYASITPNMRRLRAFEKLELAPGASQRVTFTIDADDLSFIDIDHNRITEPGEFTLMVGDKKATLNYVAK